jgi:hypothetical protein
VSYTLCYADLTSPCFFQGSTFETVAIPAYNGQTLGDLLDDLSIELNSIPYSFWETDQTTEAIVNDFKKSQNGDLDRIIVKDLDSDYDEETWIYWYFLLIPDDLD